MPRPEPATTKPRPPHWDHGQLGENEAPTFGDWLAIDHAHDKMRCCFPRMTPAHRPGKRPFMEEAPTMTSRALQPMNGDHPVNRQAKDAALDSIRPADLFQIGAVFVGPDANHAIVTRRHDGTFFVSYFDSAVAKPWKTATYSSLKCAVVAVTWRQLYLFSTR